MLFKDMRKNKNTRKKSMKERKIKEKNQGRQNITKEKEL